MAGQFDNQNQGERVREAIHDNLLPKLAERLAEGVQGAYGVGVRHDQPRYYGRGEESLPEIKFHQHVNQDSRIAANDMVERNDQRMAQAELHNAKLLDREFGHPGQFYGEVIRALSNDVRERTRDQEQLLIGNTRGDGPTQLSIVPNHRGYYDGHPPYAQPSYRPNGNYQGGGYDSSGQPVPNRQSNPGAFKY